MKNRVKWLIVPVMGSLALSACKKSQPAPPQTEATPAPATPSPPAADAPAAPEPAPAPSLTAEARAAKFGFIGHLPQDTEVVASFYNGSKTATRVKASKLWKLIAAETSGLDPLSADPDVQELPDAVTEAADEVTEGAAEGPAGLFTSEFTIALGKSTGDQAANLMTVNRRMSYFQMRNVARAVVAAARDGGADAIPSSISEGYSDDIVADLVKDPESGLALLERSQMPPCYFAFRVAGEAQPAAAQQIAALVANLNVMGDNVEPIETEVSGTKFEGLRIVGAKLATLLEEEREDLESNLDAATVDQLLAILAKKDIVAVSGTIGDYVLLFIGSSVADLKLSATPAESMAATDSMKFADAFAAKDLSLVVHGQKEALETIYASTGGISTMTDGLRDGLSGAEGLGDTRDLEAMFQIVSEREAALRKLVSNDASGTVAYFEDGLKIESFGGTDSGAFDWKAPHQLSHLCDGKDVVFFSNMVISPDYNEKAHAYFEALFETAYAMTLKVTEMKLPEGNAEVSEFTRMARMFDTTFRADLVSLWGAFNGDLGEGLGNENALVIDLKGETPAVPGIPQEVVNEAKVPRISLVYPVQDRAKLSSAWDKMNAGSTRLLARIGEMTGKEIPMQKPLSSEKNDLTTWFFPFPFTTDDFLPSVTVGDKWFAASTSKNQAVDLIGKAAAGGPSRDGFSLHLNVALLEQYAEETFKIVDANAEAIMGQPLEAEQKTRILKGIHALGDLDSMDVHSRREQNTLRTTVHLKTR